MLSLFAVLLGTGGLLSQASGGGGLFTLSLPVSRSRLLGVRAATGLAELAVLAFVPMLLLPLISPAVGERFGVVDALVHASCFFGPAPCCSAWPACSTVFADVWRRRRSSWRGTCLVSEPFFGGLSRYSLFGIMNGETYFRDGGVRGWSCSPARRCRR